MDHAQGGAPASTNWRSTLARIAHKKKVDPSADVTDLRRQLKAERLEEHILHVVNAAPPLTPAQRDHLAHVLRGGAA